jgi:UDP-3-O-acyl-N-acetylglucosamine deacetylase
LPWPAEPVWHKLLDALGDLWLVGPVAGAIELLRPTHALTLRLLREADAAGWHG